MAKPRASQPAKAFLQAKLPSEKVQVNTEPATLAVTQHAGVVPAGFVLSGVSKTRHSHVEQTKSSVVKQKPKGRSKLMRQNKTAFESWGHLQESTQDLIRATALKVENQVTSKTSKSRLPPASETSATISVGTSSDMVGEDRQLPTPVMSQEPDVGSEDESIEDAASNRSDPEDVEMEDSAALKSQSSQSSIQDPNETFLYAVHYGMEGPWHPWTGTHIQSGLHTTLSAANIAATAVYKELLKNWRHYPITYVGFRSASDGLPDVPLRTTQKWHDLQGEVQYAFHEVDCGVQYISVRRYDVDRSVQSSSIMRDLPYVRRS